MVELLSAVDDLDEAAQRRQALDEPTVKGVDVDRTHVADSDPADSNHRYATLSGQSYRGVIEYTEQPLVSHDIVGNPASCVFFRRDTMANGRVVKILGWYDNEWATPTASST